MIFVEKDDIEAIVKKYSNMVYKLALARTKNIQYAEDVFQEVFIKLIKNINKIQSNEHCKAWLIRTTINCSNDIFKSGWFKHFTLLNDSYDIKQESDISSLEHSDVYSEVLNLPIKYRTVIHLFYYEDMSVKSIAENLNKKESTIKSQLLRGRNILKNKLEGVLLND